MATGEKQGLQSAPPGMKPGEPGERIVIETARGRFAAFAYGPAGAPVVLCVHGFPDTPATFSALLPALAAAGYRAVAPWLRGYAPGPLDGEFGAEALGADLLTQCQALACTRVIGHDWGALAVYAALRQTAAPTQLVAAVTLAVPDLGTVLRNLQRVRNLGQLWRSLYILRFQLPDATRFLHRRELSYVDTLWRRWSPALPLPTAHLQAVKHTLRESGAAPLRHYQALPASLWRLLRQPAPSLPSRSYLLSSPGPGPGPGTGTPLLYLAGSADGCMSLSMCHGQAVRHGGPYAERRYPGAGHFLHLERPTEVAADILAWFARWGGPAHPPP